MINHYAAVTVGEHGGLGISMLITVSL